MLLVERAQFLAPPLPVAVGARLWRTCCWREMAYKGKGVGPVPMGSTSSRQVRVQAPHISNKHSTQLKVSESGEVSSSLIFTFLLFCYLLLSGHFESYT